MSVEIPLEMKPEHQLVDRSKKLSYLPTRPPVDIEFSDICYTVPHENGAKLILRNVSGLFRSGQLTAILGPSGAGKSTLLNTLAGYKTGDATGSILVNGKPRDLSSFHKLSRYIMQEDLLQQGLTVQESMEVSAHLKIGKSQTKEGKLRAISEILDMLRLTNARNTFTSRLSGGEKKRLSIALELVNNPPVIFLDEPTTGLDDLSSSQCISLLKQIAKGGRTVICSIHTPSARLFAMFDHVYIVAQGQCVYQGVTEDVVPFLNTVGLPCPTHYNPADFVIEVSSGEYGNFVDKMSSAVDNGKVYIWSTEPCPQPTSRTNPVATKEQNYDFSTSGWSQFCILFYRMSLQLIRDRKWIFIKLCIMVFCSLLVGGMFWQMGNDGSKTLFNYGYIFVCLIACLYFPMLPILLEFPTEFKMLKREYFNRWYGLTPYFCAYTLAYTPIVIFLQSIYLIITYIMTGQPLEFDRFVMFLALLLLVTVVSSGFAYTLASFFNVVNGVFMGPALSVPLMLLAVYGLGTGSNSIPGYMKFIMNFSFLRYGIEGVVKTLYGGDRGDMICPEEEIYCPYKSPKALLKVSGMEDAIIWVDLLALIAMYVTFRLCSFLLLRFRLTSNKKIAALNRISRFIKTKVSYTLQH